MARRVLTIAVYIWNALMVVAFAYLLGTGAAVARALDEGESLGFGLAAFLAVLAVAAAGNIVLGTLWLVSGKSGQ